MSGSSRAALSPTKKALLQHWIRGRPRKRREEDIRSLPPGVETHLSFVQERVWFLEQLDPDTPVQNIFGALAVNGPFDIEAMRRTFHELVRRHSVLRTAIESVEGEPHARLHAEWTDRFTVEDAAQLDEQGVAEVIDEEARRPFHLEAPPLLRARVLRRGPDDHVLLVTMHHICSDGGSVPIFVREMIDLYVAYAAGREPEVPPLPIQYVDYAAWQRQRLDAQRSRQLLEFWTDHLRGVPLVFELPGRKPASFEATPVLGEVPIEIPRGLEGELAARFDATPFMVLLTAWGAALGLATGRQDVVIGTPSRNRLHPHAEKMVGLFANTLAFKIPGARDAPFRALVAEVKEAVLRGYQFQELPFERLVAALNPPRDESRTPVFQAAFQVQLPVGPIELPGTRCQLMTPNSFRPPRCELSLSFLQDERGSIRGALRYAANVYDPPVVEALARDYLRLVQAVASNPNSTSSGLLS